MHRAWQVSLTVYRPSALTIGVSAVIILLGGFWREKDYHRGFKPLGDDFLGEQVRFLCAAEPKAHGLFRAVGKLGQGFDELLRRSGNRPHVAVMFPKGFFYHNSQYVLSCEK